MIPKRIELENFLSFGTPAVEFTFNDDEPLWVLCGQNGVGKSAVFDGITYALYGEHRGGAQKAEQLIRHRANGFRVVLHFEFAGVEYRITRVRAGRTTQKVERRVAGDWEAVPGVNSSTDVKEWVETTLGLGYKAFTTSVLLRQGEADKLFSASREERIAVLKGIIGFERFEDVSQRVHAATLRRGHTLDTLRRQLSGLAPVTPEELDAAEAAVVAAEQKRQDVQAELTHSARRVEQAKQWEGLQARRAGLERQLAEAELRSADAPAIRAARTRLDELTTTVPELESLVRLRDRLAVLASKLADAEATHVRTAADLEARLTAAGEARQQEAHHKEQAEQADRRVKSLAEEILRGEKFLQLADAVAALKGKLAAYPTDLADQVACAEADEKAAGAARQRAAADLSAATALLEQARKRRDRFADVTVGVTCSQCGQLVDEAHAATERERIAQEIRGRDADAARLRVALTAAETGASAVCQRRASLQKQKAECDKQSAALAATVANLTQLGGVVDAAELRARLTQQRQERQQAEVCTAEERGKQSAAAREVSRLDQERRRLDTELRAAADVLRQHEIERAADSAAYNAAFTRLAPDWQARFGSLDMDGVRELVVERNRLQQSGVTAQFELLQQDERMRAEWSKQLDEVRTGSDLIPDEARIPARQAQRHQGEAQAAAESANAGRDEAIRTRDGLQSRAEAHQRLTTQLRVAEREHDVHRKLDDLLGQNGLQRELVRDAEQQIVGLANDTLHNLSDGDLCLEPDDEASGRDDKAFALRVRRAGDPQPIGVQFLSGSQKFRVAVSVALAVGRFASGRARPLEAVIIDEGFGSLDKDGLRAMADELMRLQQSQSLRRVILVSHQDEFASRFPVGYRLTAGDNGTVAAPFRQS